jgi:hypothetical protein
MSQILSLPWDQAHPQTFLLFVVLPHIESTNLCPPDTQNYSSHSHENQMDGSMNGWMNVCMYALWNGILRGLLPDIPGALVRKHGAA